MTVPDIVPPTAEVVTTAASSAGSRSGTPERPSLRRRVMGLALPAIGENLLHTALGIADTVLVAGIGVVALAGVGAALNVLFIVAAALSSLSVGASVLVAQAIGASNLVRASHVTGQALVWGVALSLPITLAGMVFAEPVVALYGMAPDATAVAAEYLMISAASIPAMALMLIGGGALRGAGDSRTPMVITALANILNLIASWALIYGHIGMPALGVAGSAWGTLIARAVGAALFLVILLRISTRLRIGGPGTWRPRWETAREVLWLGAPAALEEMIIITSFAALTPIVAGLGTAALAAHRVALNVLSLSFMPGIGFSLATTALVGQAVGAGRLDEARAVTNVAMRWAILWMGGLGALFILFAPQLVGIFSSDPELIAIGAAAVQVVALAQPLWAGTFVIGGALRGIGDTRTPMVISGILGWAAVGIAMLLVCVWPALWAVWLAYIFTGPPEMGALWHAWRGKVQNAAEVMR
ncbi:MAG: MATE family efflux transporter [Roseiflexus sp.]|nr:MATE family efflux transporter [Roseiflexus sp.]MCS7289920.1 MATE family efflux transporter [Roseiflexus sp.]MDW8146834.1 MATE family efflux transporter [Roseiflexaceae bacterium]MDW8231833.1 MATE family efflux transporter [Roseiflexaceae bacterium]